MKYFGRILAFVALIVAGPVSADLITNGDFESDGLNTTNTSISGSSGPFGEWLALSGHWEIDSGQASNSTNYAENPDFNYIMMQGVDLSGFSASFDSQLSFDYAYEGGFGGLDGRGVRVFGMEAADTTQIFFTGTTFNNLDLLFSHQLSPTGNPTTSFVNFTSTSFTVDPTQFSALLVVFTFGGSPDLLRAVDNVSLTGPTAVAEPGTLALLGLGLAAIGLVRRRKTG